MPALGIGGFCVSKDHLLQMKNKKMWVVVPIVINRVQRAPNISRFLVHWNQKLSVVWYQGRLYCIWNFIYWIWNPNRSCVMGRGGTTKLRFSLRERERDSTQMHVCARVSQGTGGRRGRENLQKTPH